ncbi:MAG: hypothetical protein ACI9K2_006333, partial [Myxococcota bacterium]
MLPTPSEVRDNESGEHPRLSEPTPHVAGVAPMEDPIEPNTFASLIA